MKIHDRSARNRHLQIVSQERSGGDKLEADVTYTIFDSRYVTWDKWSVIVLGSSTRDSYHKT
jgi:hypothetical protein